MAEVDRYAKQLLLPSVVAEQQIVIQGNGCKLRERLLYAEQGLFHIADGHW